MARLSRDRHEDFIVGRFLREGGWEAMMWLRRDVGDDRIRLWLERHRGRGLAPRRLRFWERVLDLPSDRVDAWVAEARAGTWGERLAP